MSVRDESGRKTGLANEAKHEVGRRRSQNSIPDFSDFPEGFQPCPGFIINHLAFGDSFPATRTTTVR